MRCPTFAELPAPTTNKIGWPWTEDSPQQASHITDGSEWPKISIVTPSYNQGQFLEETVRSILLQRYPNLEYIIIDGGSTDDSVQIIKKYESHLAYWVSESDKGQSEAINKGLAQSTGEIFNWINSDDVLMPGALWQIALTNKDSDAIAGNVMHFDNNGRQQLFVSSHLTGHELIVGHTNTVYQQPGLWLRRGYINECGGIDKSLHYSFDIDLAIRYLNKFPKVAYLPETLVRFRIHPDSKTMSQFPKFFEEQTIIFQKLSKLPQFQYPPSFWKLLCRKACWATELAYIAKSNSVRFWKAILVAWAACQEPNIRFSKMTMGLILKYIVG